MVYLPGNITFMDRLERLAFNSLPAALWPDVTASHETHYNIAPPFSTWRKSGFEMCFASQHSKVLRVQTTFRIQNKYKMNPFIPFTMYSLGQRVSPQLEPTHVWRAVRIQPVLLLLGKCVRGLWPTVLKASRTSFSFFFL